MTSTRIKTTGKNGAIIIALFAALTVYAAIGEAKPLPVKGILTVPSVREFNESPAKDLIRFRYLHRLLFSPNSKMLNEKNKVYRFYSPKFWDC